MGVGGGEGVVQSAIFTPSSRLGRQWALGFRQTSLVGRAKEVNTRLNAKTSGWPIVSPSRMSTIVTGI